MAVRTHRLTVQTHQPLELLDVTDEIRAWVRQTGVRDGLVTVFSPHTTARITLNERESELQRDMVRFLETLAPATGEYFHNQKPVDDRLNAHAHLLGLFVNASESIPLIDGELLIGAWQSLFVVELDGPREAREVIVLLIESA